jgi:hypothetical protein
MAVETGGYRFVFDPNAEDCCLDRGRDHSYVLDLPEGVAPSANRPVVDKVNGFEECLNIPTGARGSEGPSSGPRLAPFGADRLVEPLFV